MYAWMCAVSFLSASAIFGAQVPSRWTDPSPHRQQLVEVESNANVEMLDWGGSGRALVLLAHLGSTAHIYDDWAPTLTGRFHVYGITRRGYGASSAVSPHHSMERMARDVVAVLDHAKLQAPVVVANGFAGEELTWLGSHFSDCLGGLV